MRLLRLVFFTYISEVINSAYGGEWEPDDNAPQGGPYEKKSVKIERTVVK